MVCNVQLATLHFVVFLTEKMSGEFFVRGNVWENFLWAMSTENGFVQVNFSQGVVSGISVRIVRGACPDLYAGTSLLTCNDYDLVNRF